MARHPHLHPRRGPRRRHPRRRQRHRQGGRLHRPTTVTAAVYSECVEWTDDDAARSNAYQDQPERLWDVLYLAATKANALARRNRHRDQVIYQLHVVPRPGHRHPRLRTLKLVIGPGDDHEPVATIMLPYED